MLAIVLLIIGILSRFVVHLPNFTPVIAIALMGGIYLNKRIAIVLPVVLLFVSDAVMGFHNTMPFTLGSVALIAAVGLWARQHKSFKTVLGSSIFSSFLFFLITNFGVWLVSGMYSHDAPGLSMCFTLAIPYFRNELASTVIYSALFYAAYELIAAKIKNTRFANAVL